MVVEDDLQMQLFLKDALERQEYAVSVAESAEAALDTLRSERFDAILMDVQMPGISGLEALDEIRKSDRVTPVIIMTADPTRGAALDAVRRGAYDYVTKPFSLDELDLIVGRAVERRQLLGELDRLSRQWDTLQYFTLDEKVAHLERAFVVEALARACGVQAAAARLLGVTERSVWHLVKKHRIEVARLKQRVG
jgi:DNA-binding NtrC family response regulator